MLQIKSFRKLRALTGITQEKYESLAADVERQYRSFDSQIGKKWRHIDNPSRDLKSVQSNILRNLLCRVALPRHMYGAKKGGSVIQHADHHKGRDCVLTLDLKDCYPRTSAAQIYQVFVVQLGCAPDIARLLTRLCTLQHHLPQGAPTSGYLSHLALLGLFGSLQKIARDHGLRLSFYVDDIAMSGLRPAVMGAMDETVATIRAHRHSVRNRKKRVMVGDERRITGLDASDVLRVPRSYVEEVENAIINAVHAGAAPETLYNSLRGRIRWVRQVCPEQADPLEELFRHVNAGTVRVKEFPRNVPCTSQATCRWWKQSRAEYARKRSGAT